MGVSAREAALEALRRCGRDGAWSGAVIDAAIRRFELDRRDAALASRLCLGVLQNQSYLDYVLDRYARGKLEPQLRLILRLGAFQLLFLDKIPPSAAVNESVKLCKSRGLERAAGLCNAVLRRISELRGALPEVEERDPVRRLSIRYSHPEWLVRRLLSEHDAAFVEAFLRCNNGIRPLYLQVNTLKVTVQDYRRALERAEIPCGEVPGLPGCLRLEGGVVSELPGYEEGLFYIQDKAARAAVEAAGPEPGAKVLDACAAPGGKSFAAAIRMENRGSILARDLHEKKLSRVREGAERLGIEILRAEARDGRLEDAEHRDFFDLVLADLPCSGLGVIGKHPEARFKREEEIDRLPDLQREILDRVSCLVRPGGVLLISTCTVLRAENEDQVLSFLERHPAFHAEAFRIGDESVPNGMKTFWPQSDDSDGFFAARLRRNQT